MDKPNGRWVCVDCRRIVYKCPDPECADIWHHAHMAGLYKDETPKRPCYAGEDLDEAQIEFVDGDEE